MFIGPEKQWSPPGEEQEEKHAFEKEEKKGKNWMERLNGSCNGCT